MQLFKEERVGGLMLMVCNIYLKFTSIQSEYGMKQDQQIDQWDRIEFGSRLRYLQTFYFHQRHQSNLIERKKVFSANRTGRTGY